MELHDILRPPLFEMGGFRFRMMRIVDHQNDADDTCEERPEHCMAKIESYDDYDDEEDCTKVNTTINYTTDITNNGVTANLDIPSIFYRHIIGQKGITKKKIEMETGVKVKLPPIGREGPVVISAPLQKNVDSAITRISLILEGEREKMPFTHFLSFPVNTEGIVNTFTTFRSDVLLNCHSSGIDSSIFQNPRKLHLTLGVVSLYGGGEVGMVEEIMKETTEKLVKDGVMGQGGVEVVMEGLEVMNDDPTAVDVLYAKVKCSNESLQTISDAYVSRLVDSGFMSRQFDTVKLHVTLMNTLFRKGNDGNGEGYGGDGGRDGGGSGGGRDSGGGGGGSSGGGGNNNNTNYNNYNNNNIKGGGGGAMCVGVYKGRSNRECFDASEILKTFHQHHFGTLTFTHLHLSKKGTVDSNGYYKHDAIVSLSS